jgi:hypothetical protein
MNAMEFKADNFIRNLGVLAVGWRNRTTGRSKVMVRHPENERWAEAMTESMRSAMKIGAETAEATRVVIKPWATFYTLPSAEGDWTVSVATEYAHPVGKSVRRELRRMAKIVGQ